MEIDVGAAFRTERLGLDCGRLSADRALSRWSTPLRSCGRPGIVIRGFVHQVSLFAVGRERPRLPSL